MTNIFLIEGIDSDIYPTTWVESVHSSRASAEAKLNKIEEVQKAHRDFKVRDSNFRKSREASKPYLDLTPESTQAFKAWLEANTAHPTNKALRAEEDTYEWDSSNSYEIHEMELED